MKLEEFLMGTKEEINNSIDQQITTAAEGEKYLLKWGGYALAETLIGGIGCMVASTYGSLPLLGLSLLVFADAGFRTMYSFGSQAKNQARIRAEMQDKPPVERLKAGLKGTLQPGIVGVARKYLNK